MGADMAKLFVDPKTLPQDAGGFVQVMFLMIVYGYILFFASNMISDGSELLLLVPALAGIVGSVVLPVLGAVPDGAIVLFSGMGPDAQKQLSVGVGALAGSTIMLLTIPWALSIYAGRVNLQNGEANYKRPKLTPEGSAHLTKTGVALKPIISYNAKVMIFTTIGYFIIQGAASEYCPRGDDCDGSPERWYAFMGLVFCVLAFVGYLWDQVRMANSDSRADWLEQIVTKGISEGHISLSAAFSDMGDACKDASGGLLDKSKVQKRFKNTIKAFFRKYDRNGDGNIDKEEVNQLFTDMHEDLSPESFRSFCQQLDKNGDGTVTFEEFAEAMVEMVTTKNESTLRDTLSRRMHDAASESYQQSAESKLGDPEVGAAHDDEEEEEEEEDIDVPEDLASLSPEEQRRRIKIRAFSMMGMGTFLVLLFSDPMVDVLSEVGERIHVPAFYVSFVLAPLASNASELIASVNYASKKTQTTIAISLSALEGAAAMNNTFCLAIFLALIFFRKLAWEYAAETISIVVVQFCVGFLAMQSSMRLRDAIMIVSLYPISIALVAGLKAAGMN